MTDNPYVINLNGFHKTDARRLLVSISPVDEIKSLKDSHNLHSVAAAYLFTNNANPVFSDIAEKISEVARGKIPGICIHGFPIGKFNKLPPDRIYNYINWALWAERSSQLLSAITGMIGHPIASAEMLNDYSYYVPPEKEINLGIEFRYKHKIKWNHLVDLGVPTSESVPHTHLMTALFGVNSGGPDIEGNDRNATTVYNSDRSVFLSEPIGRGTFILIGDGVEHGRIPGFKKTNMFLRDVRAVNFSTDKLSRFSEDEIKEYIKEHFTSREVRVRK